MCCTTELGECFIYVGTKLSLNTNTDKNIFIIQIMTTRVQWHKLNLSSPKYNQSLLTD